MDPGRKKIEDREAEWLAIGDRIINNHGVDLEVIGIQPSVNPKQILITVKNIHAQLSIGPLAFDRSHPIRTRVR